MTLFFWHKFGWSMEQDPFHFTWNGWRQSISWLRFYFLDLTVYSREYDFRKNRMAEKNTSGRPWLICWGFIVDPKNLETKAWLLFYFLKNAIGQNDHFERGIFFSWFGSLDDNRIGVLDGFVMHLIETSGTLLSLLVAKYVG